MEVELGVMWCKIGSEFIPREHARKSVRRRRRHRGERRAEAEPADGDRGRGPELNIRFIFPFTWQQSSNLPSN